MTLKERHLAELKSENAKDIYARLLAAVESRDGQASDSCLMLIMDFCRIEQLKELLNADIAQRGLGSQVHNYRQTFYRENESVAKLHKCIDQQRKLLGDLKLTPASRKDADAPIGGDELADF